MRADIFLYTNGFAKSRTHASELIKSGVLLDGKKSPSRHMTFPIIQKERALPFSLRQNM